MIKPSVASVGCGYFSQFHHHAWRRLEVELPGICDLEIDRAEQFCKNFGGGRAYDEFEAMLEAEKPNLVDIILPPAQHLEHIRIASNYADTIICQKPFTESLEQARQAAEIAEQSDTLLVVHENFRFQPWYRKIKEILDQGILGEIYQARFALRPGDGQGEDAYLVRQPYFQKMDRFLIHETGIHFIDIFRYLFGEARSVWADLRQLNPVICGEDAGIIVMELESGTRATFDGNRLCDHVADNHRLTMGELVIEGSTATLDLNGRAEILIRKKDSNSLQNIEYNWHDHGFGGDCVYNLQRHVLKHLANGTVPENCAADYISNLEIESAVYDSNSCGSRISLLAGVD